MFIGDFEKAAPWSMSSIKGSKRFLDKIFASADNLIDDNSYRKENESKIHRTIKKVTSDIDDLKMNTAIAALMTLFNDLTAKGNMTKGEFKTFITLLNPFAPHITEELWQTAGFDGMLNETTWPLFDESKTVDLVVEIPVQVNGKIRARIFLPVDADDKTALDIAKKEKAVSDDLSGKNIIKEIYVKGRIINIVAK